MVLANIKAFKVGLCLTGGPHSSHRGGRPGEPGRHQPAVPTHLPVAQQDYPHQDDIDVGPQGLIVIDFVDLKDNQGHVSRNHRLTDQPWLCKWHRHQLSPRAEPGHTPTILPPCHTLRSGSESTPSFPSAPPAPLRQPLTARTLPLSTQRPVRPPQGISTETDTGMWTLPSLSAGAANCNAAFSARVNTAQTRVAGAVLGLSLAEITPQVLLVVVKYSLCSSQLGKRSHFRRPPDLMFNVLIKDRYCCTTKVLSVFCFGNYS